VPNPTELLEFWERRGMVPTADGALGTTDRPVQLRIAEGGYRHMSELHMSCEADQDLADIAARIGEMGVASTIADTRLTCIDPVFQHRVVIDVTTAHPLTPTQRRAWNHPGEQDRVNARADATIEAAPRPPRRLGHFVLGTPHFTEATTFFFDGLGFKVSDSLDGVIAFLRCSTDHHNIGVVESPVPQLQHYSWECDDVDHVGHTATALYRVDPERQVWGMGRHFAGSNFYWYLRDPSGSFIELYSDLDQILDDEAWEAVGRTEFDFGHVANSWGPNLPVEFIVPDDLDALQTGWERWPS